MREVADKYGIPDPNDLDGGGPFSEDQRRVLFRLYDNWNRSESEDAARAYIEQKAKFIVVRQNTDSRN